MLIQQAIDFKTLKLIWMTIEINVSVVFFKTKKNKNEEKEKKKIDEPIFNYQKHLKTETKSIHKISSIARVPFVSFESQLSF